MCAACEDAVAEPHGAILEALEAYQRAFSAHRPELARRSYHCPCTFVDAQSVTVCSSPAEIEDALGAIIQSLEARGWSHSEWSEVFVRPLDDTRAIVSTVAIRHASDGSELERIGGTYAFLKTDEGWKIAMTLAHPAAAVLRFGEKSGDADSARRS